MKRLFWIVAVPLVLLAALFATANRGPVEIDLWPLSGHVELPLFVALTAAAYAGFLAGAFVAWTVGGRARSRARAATRRAESLERDVAALRRRLEEMPPPGTRPAAEPARLLADQVHP